MADKRYDQFTAGTPASTDITLFADPATGALKKVALSGLPYPANTISTLVSTLRGMGSALINFPAIFTTGNINTGANLGSTQAFYTAVYLPAGLVTGFTYVLLTAGNFTANNVNSIALYSFTGTSMTRVGITANDGNIWKGGTSFWRQEPMLATATITAGVYIIAYLYCSSAQTTAPLLGGYSLNNSDFNSSGIIGNTLPLFWYQSSATTLPSTISPPTVNGFPNPLPIVGVY